MTGARAAARVLLAVLTLGAAGAHGAALGDNTVRLAPSRLKLPQNIGPLRYNGESRFSDRRMGRSFGYNASGITLNINVYDYGARDLPDGPDSVAACEQFESAKREIERGGNYQNVELRGEYRHRMNSVGSLSAVREAVYEFDRNGIHAVSALWVTAADGHFFKLRLSLRAEVADELEEARAQILAALSAAFAARAARAAPAADFPGPEASIEVAANPDAAATAAWLAYATELMRFAGEHPQMRPPCGGPLVPGFDAELAARRAALAEYRARAAAHRTSSYFNVLEGIDAAGFLDEYVWHYLRNERLDLRPPAGIELPAFEQFRRQELATHVAQSGARVRVNVVRMLPPAPAP